MNKSIKVIILLLGVVFLGIVGFSSFVFAIPKDIPESNFNHNTSDNDMSQVNLHYETVDLGGEVITEYYIPNNFNVTYDIRDKDADGNTQYQAYGDPGSGLNDTEGDKILQYYDVVNGKYSKIDQHSNTNGPEQIKSLKIDVLDWKKTSSESDYGVVWKTEVVNSSGETVPLRFACDSGNSVNGHGQKYPIGSIYQNDIVISQDTVVDGNKTTITTIYQRITVYDNGDLVYGQGAGCVDYKVWYYFPQYEWRMTKITSTSGETIEHDHDEAVQVKTGSIIDAIDLQIPNYKNYGYFKDSGYTEYFDFNEPITGDCDIYLRYIQSGEFLAQSINNLEEGATLNIYDKYRGGSGTGINVGEDPTYHVPTNSFFIDEATVKNNVTLNLTYNNSKIYTSPIEGTVPSEELGAHRTNSDYYTSTKISGTSSPENVGYSKAGCYAILNGNLTINGTMNIGGEIGGRGASYIYSYIIGSYALLDLHGHNITINNGGVLNNFGVIIDSVGGGEIIVKEGGVIKTVVTITDGRGRDQTAVGLGKRQTPFSEYKLSYLQVPCTFMNGSSLTGYIKLDFDALGVINTNITFIANGKNSALFSRNDEDKDSRILFIPYQIDELSAFSTQTIYSQMYNRRNKFVFDANVQEAGEYIIEASLTTPIGKLNASFDFARIDFPISPFFDLEIVGDNTMEIYSKMTFYPGSSLYVDYDSTLRFCYEGYKTFDEVSMYLTIPGESRYIAGGIMSYSNRISDLASSNYSNNRFNIGVYKESSYWNYVKTGNVFINGNITFDENISRDYDDSYYYLSGPISLSDNAILNIKTNREIIKTYDYKAELHSGFFYNKDNQELDAQYEFATSFNLNPLISNEKAYIIDKDYDLEGQYNISTGIFESLDGNYYFLQAANTLYEGGSSGSAQGNRIDKNLSITEIEEMSINNAIIKADNGNNYIYYCGTFLPTKTNINFNEISNINNFVIQVDLTKFISNLSATCNVTFNEYDSSVDPSKPVKISVNIANLYNDVSVKYNSSQKKWQFYQFNAYPKEGENKWYSY